MSATPKKPATCLEAMAGCAFVLILPLATALGSIYDAWIAVKLWTWFLASYAHVPTPSIAVFIGVDYLAALLFRKRTGGTEDTAWAALLGRFTVSLVIFPTVLLVAAYLIHRWIS